MGLGGLEENGRPSPDAALALGLQKEEELRKEEERKKALDERLRFEQERMEQERQEQEERERRYREREQQIEEHRWVSPHWGPSGHVPYPPNWCHVASHSRRKQQTLEAEEAKRRLKEQSIFVSSLSPERGCPCVCVSLLEKREKRQRVSE